MEATIAICNVLGGLGVLAVVAYPIIGLVRAIRGRELLSKSGR